MSVCVYKDWMNWKEVGKRKKDIGLKVLYLSYGKQGPNEAYILVQQFIRQ